MVWRAVTIHRTLDPLNQNIRSLSFVALERSSKIPVATSGCKVLANYRSRRKHTLEPTGNGERL